MLAAPNSRRPSRELRPAPQPLGLDEHHEERLPLIRMMMAIMIIAITNMITISNIITITMIIMQTIGVNKKLRIISY